MDERERETIAAGDVGTIGPGPMTPEQEADVRAIERRCTRCGADVNDEIVAGGADGKEHEAPCPGCGRVFTWRAPRYYA